MAAPTPRPGWLRRHGGKVLASLVAAAAFVWLLHRGALPLIPPASAFARVKWWTVGAYVVLWSVVHVVRAARWTWLLTPICPVPMRRILAVSFVGFAAIALLPLRMGEVVRPILIHKEGKLSGWAATGTVAAERIIDGLFLSAMLFAGLFLSTPQSPLPDHIGALPISPAIVPRASYGALVLFAVAFTVMGVFYAQRKWARRTTERVIGIASPKFATWLADRVEHVAAGLRFLPNLRFTVPFVAATAIYWLANAAGMWLVGWGTGFDDYTYAEACVTTGVVALGIMVPSGPGFFGAYQMSFYAALAVFFPPELVVGPGAACVLIVYSAQILITIAGAGVGSLLEKTSLEEALTPGAENLASEGSPE